MRVRVAVCSQEHVSRNGPNVKFSPPGWLQVTQKKGGDRVFGIWVVELDLDLDLVFLLTFFFFLLVIDKRKKNGLASQVGLAVWNAN